MDIIKKTFFIFVILTSVYGCASTREYAKSVFLNLQLVSTKIFSVMMFDKENEELIVQLEAHEEQINMECSALQQSGYRRMMGDPVSSDLEYEAAISLQECNKVVLQADQFLKKNGL